MEKIISKKLLEKVTKDDPTESLKFYNQATESRKRSRFSLEIPIFLSHKHSEKEIVKQVIVLLKRLGVEVYIS